MVTDQLAFLGSQIINILDGSGRFAYFSGSTIRWTIRGVGQRGHRRRFRLLMPQLFLIGTRSLPVVMLVGLFVGMVLSVETYAAFHKIGQEQMLGAIINTSVVRQIGPVLAAVMIAGRVGGAVSAEIGSMRVTEQLDALTVMGADPIGYLVVPRVLACVMMVPVLTVFSDLLGIYGGYLVTVKSFGVASAPYWEKSQQFVRAYDLFSGLSKSAFFGLAIGLISCYKGFTCRSGAAGVGRAVTESFVASFVAIIILNFFLAKFLADFWYVLY